MNKQQGAVTTVSVEDSSVKLFLTSDVHFDSVYCDRKAFFQDMEEAVKQKAKVCIFGDLVDAMNGRFDPRRDMSMLRPEYRRADYYDFIVNDLFDKLKKYKDNILIITAGNHELSVLKNANTYLSDRLSKKLGCLHGGYGGWLKIQLNVKGFRGSVNIKYFHGSGGEAPVTRGVIQTNRQAVYLPDADIVVNGHSHNAFWVPIQRERLTEKGTQYFDTQHHIRTPGYMASYGDGSTGWEVTRGGVPKPLGGCFVTIKRLGKSDKQCPIEIQPVIHNSNPVSPVNDLFAGTVYPQE
jgi:predicted phosphodiesterase